MPEFHPILTTDYFEYGTTDQPARPARARPSRWATPHWASPAPSSPNPPNWAVVRNMSDPVINGTLPAKQFHLNEQTTWAVGYYTAYGKWTSVIGALATWGDHRRPRVTNSPIPDRSAGRRRSAAVAPSP